jgi:hypothetical protein
MGINGAADCLSWKKGWHSDNVALFYKHWLACGSDKILTPSSKSLASLTGGNDGIFYKLARYPADQGHYACPQK